MKHGFWVCLLLLASSTAGCGDDRACSTDADCFSGEVCGSDDQCVKRGDSNNVLNNGVVANNVDNNGVAQNNTVNNGTLGDTCAIDPIGNTCSDDFFEENDLYSQTLPLPIEADSWCLDGELAQPSQTFGGTICAGDQADLYRFLIDNRTPHACLADSFTVRITVEFDKPCDGEDLIRVFPYAAFENPVLNSPCGEDENMRCTVSDDQRTYTFEWLRRAEQLVDARLNIEPREDYVQVDYTVTVEIVQ